MGGVSKEAVNLKECEGLVFLATSGFFDKKRTQSSGFRQFLSAPQLSVYLLSSYNIGTEIDSVFKLHEI